MWTRGCDCEWEAAIAFARALVYTVTEAVSSSDLARRRKAKRRAMSHNLFLEGPIQTGKSTLIRQALGDELGRCGGFACQRLTDAGGNTLGFRLGPAATTELTAPFPSAAQSAGCGSELAGCGDPGCAPGDYLTDPEALHRLGIFMYPGADGGRARDLRVFSEEGLRLLREAGAKATAPPYPLVLLDEIGGVELSCDNFYFELLELLRSDIPCLGVLKLREGLCRLAGCGKPDAPVILDRYDTLRQLIETDEDSRILYFERTAATDKTTLPRSCGPDVFRIVSDFVRHAVSA